MWRNTAKLAIKGWIGLGVVVCMNEKHSSAWVSMRGVLVKTNTERVRPATDQEWLGVEVARVLSAEAKQQQDGEDTWATLWLHIRH